MGDAAGGGAGSAVVAGPGSAGRPPIFGMVVGAGLLGIAAIPEFIGGSPGIAAELVLTG